MTTLAEIRQEVASLLSDVSPVFLYPPESLAPPAAWIDALQIDVQGNSMFCDLGNVDGSVVFVNLRNDLASSLSELEAQIPTVIGLLEKGNYVVTNVQSGTADVGGAQLVAVTYNFETTI